MSRLKFATGAGHRRGRARRARPMRSRTTQAIGQQHTSPLRARCEACRRKVAVICGCGNGLARDAPEASKVDGELRAGGPQGCRPNPGGTCMV